MHVKPEPGPVPAKWRVPGGRSVGLSDEHLGKTHDSEAPRRVPVELERLLHEALAPRSWVADLRDYAVELLDRARRWMRARHTR